MAALERASVGEDIVPFAEFLAKARHEGTCRRAPAASAEGIVPPDKQSGLAEIAHRAPRWVVSIIDAVIA
jgi:hypothetical protein